MVVLHSSPRHELFLLLGECRTAVLGGGRAKLCTEYSVTSKFPKTQASQSWGQNEMTWPGPSHSWAAAIAQHGQTDHRFMVPIVLPVHGWRIGHSWAETFGAAEEMPQEIHQ
ncbi:hypothetical protein O3P69_012887 [Scylla paramamosain]|uniref:Uncharacterized protein n=1 Tax=Scylla paramamosain TaxID=85552 RepID=A0AAW0TR65_SCYPA